MQIIILQPAVLISAVECKVANRKRDECLLICLFALVGRPLQGWAGLGYGGLGRALLGWDGLGRALLG